MYNDALSGRTWSSMYVVPRVNKGEPPQPSKSCATTKSITGPAVDGDPVMQLSPRKLLCGDRGGADKPEDNRPA